MYVVQYKIFGVTYLVSTSLTIAILLLALFEECAKLQIARRIFICITYRSQSFIFIRPCRFTVPHYTVVQNFSISQMRIDFHSE